MSNVIDIEAYRRERAIDEAICGIIEARAEKIIDEYRDVINSDAGSRTTRSFATHGQMKRCSLVIQPQMIRMPSSCRVIFSTPGSGATV